MMRFKTFYLWLVRYEKYLFGILVLLNTLPLFVTKYFLTLDGPVHLHNSNIMLYLLNSNETIIRDFYHWNVFSLSNWLDHFLLLLFNTLLPAYMAEKLLVFLILIGLPYSFRFFIRNNSKINPLLIYLIFPFTWNQLLMNGFFNFLLALILFFVLFSIWNPEKARITPKRLFYLLLTMLLLSLAHVFIFILAVAIGLLWGIYSHYYARKKNIYLKSEKSNITWRNTKTFLICSLIGFLLVFSYILKGSENNEVIVKTSRSILNTLHDIRTVKPMLALNYSEQHITSWWFLFLVVLVVLVIIHRLIRIKYIVRFKRNLLKQIFAFNRKDFFILMAGFSFIGYIIFDRWMKNDLYINDRFILIAFLLLLTWLIFQRTPIWLSVLVLMISVFFSFSLMNSRLEKFENASNRVSEVFVLAQKIEKGSTVFAKSFSNDIHNLHILDYAGVEKPIVLLQNFECSKSYFPLMWNPDRRNQFTSFEKIIQNVPLDSSKIIFPDYLMLFFDDGIRKREVLVEIDISAKNKMVLVDSSCSGNIVLLRSIN